MSATTSCSSNQQLWDQARNGLATGGAIMLAQAPIVNACNRVSVASCRHDLSTAQTVHAVYQGQIDKAPKKSFRHFARGMEPHLLKESCRVGFKTGGLMAKPALDHHFKGEPYGQQESDLTFATVLAGAEMLIQPVDTRRTMSQAGSRDLKGLTNREVIAHLYKGAVASGAKQFGIWAIYPATERASSHALKEHTTIDPQGAVGNTVKSMPQSVVITSSTWLPERIKNELQYHPQLNTLQAHRSRYSAACAHIFSTQGWRGFTRGLAAKIAGNTPLVMGANYILENARKAQRKRAAAKAN